MHFDPCPKLLDPRSDLENLESDCVELSPGPLRSLKMPPPQGMQQHISHGMKEEAELVGFEAMTVSYTHLTLPTKRIV